MVKYCNLLLRFRYICQFLTFAASQVSVFVAKVGKIIVDFTNLRTNSRCSGVDATENQHGP